MKRLTLAAALALALLAGTTPSANGGVYKAIQCHERVGAGHPDASFAASSQRYRSSASCAGRGLGVTHEPGSSRTGSGRYGAWTITAPDGTEIIRAAAQVTASRENLHVPQVHVGLDGGARNALARVEGELHKIDWTGSGGRYFSGRLACSSGKDCGEGRNAHIYMRRIAFTLRDETAPAVQLGGTLLEPGSRRGDQVLDVNAIDTGSGVRSITVELNEKPIQARVLECHLANRVALRLRPCPGNATPRFEIDTKAAAFRQGPNQLRVCASDYAPQATANRTCETRTVRVDNKCPLSEATGSVLRARFRGAGTEVTSRSDAATHVTGEVVDEGGNPLRGARVCVATRVSSSDGPPERVVATPTTGSDGRFEARIPAGPSREVRIAHWRGDHDVVERFLELRSKAVPRLDLTPKRGLSNGDSVRFDVAIPGPSQANREVAVEAKGKGRWIRIASGRTNRSGRWNGSYRFRNTTDTRRYAFRAVVGREEGYPYLPGQSKTRHAKVTG
jgi:hypothetical protein